MQTHPAPSRDFPGYRCLVDGSLGRFKNSRKQDAKSLCQRSSRNRFHSIFRQTPAKSFRHASHLQCCCVKPLFSEPGNKSFAASVGKGKGTAVRHWLLQNRPQKFLHFFFRIYLQPVFCGWQLQQKIAARPSHVDSAGHPVHQQDQAEVMWETRLPIQGLPFPLPDLG